MKTIIMLKTGKYSTKVNKTNYGDELMYRLNDNNWAGFNINKELAELLLETLTLYLGDKNE